MSVEARILSSSGRRQATMALMIATAMQAFDTTIANVALPQLEQSLGGGIELGSWVMTSYLCASAIMATLTGWLRRRYGARPLFIGSISLFIIASGLCSIAPSSVALIQFRLVQGTAAGIIQPLAQAILLDLYPQQRSRPNARHLGSDDHGRPDPRARPRRCHRRPQLMAVDFRFELSSRLDRDFGFRPGAIDDRAATKARIDSVGLVLLIIGVGSLQLALQRMIGQTWPLSAETAAEAAVAVFALAGIAIRSLRSQFTLFRFQVFRSLNFSAAVFYNFLVGALLFTTIVFLPALSEGPLGYDATQAGLALSPRGIATMATMLAVHYLIDRVDHRALLGTGIVITAGALVLMSRVPADGGGLWLAAASAIQGIGVGLLFTPLSTLAFSTLDAELRTDAAGVYSLLRQLGCATGVAVMTAVLQARIHGNSLPGFNASGAGIPSPSEAASYGVFAAYTGCFQTMAIITAVTLPGILLFRVLRPEAAAPRAA